MFISKYINNNLYSVYYSPLPHLQLMHIYIYNWLFELVNNKSWFEVSRVLF